MPNYTGGGGGGGTSAPSAWMASHTATPSATADTYGAYATIALPTGWNAGDPQSIHINYTGISAETVTVQTTATRSDGTTATVTWPTESADTDDYGSTDVALASVAGQVDLTALLKNGCGITQLQVRCKSSIPSSAVTVTATVGGNVGGAQGPAGPAGAAGANGADGVVQSVVAGTNVTVDSTDPANPIVSASGGASFPAGNPGDLYVRNLSGTVVALPHGSPGQVLTIPPADSLFVAYDGAHDGTSGADTGLPTGNPAGFSWSGLLKWTASGEMGLFAYGGGASDGDVLDLYQINSASLGSQMGGFQTPAGPDGPWVITPINDGALHHLAFTYDGTVAEVYIDSASQGTKRYNGTPNVVSGNIKLAGSNVQTGGYNGKKAFDAFWNRKLSAAEVLAQYNAIAAGTYIGTINGQAPVHFFQQQEPSGTTATDTGSAPVDLTYTAGVTLAQSPGPLPVDVVPAWA